MKRINLQKGATLVEALIALAVVAAIATGIVIAVITSLSGTTYNQNSNFALNFAQEGSDLVRDQAASSFSSISGLSADYYCLSDQDNTVDSTDNKDANAAPCSTSNLYNIQLNDNSQTQGVGNFIRRIYINPTGCDSRKGSCNQVCLSGTIFVASMVAFSDAKCKGGTSLSPSNCHVVEIDSCITDLNKLQ